MLNYNTILNGSSRPLPAADPLLQKLGERLIAQAGQIESNLIPLKSTESVQSLREYFPSQPLCVCDFIVQGAELWRPCVGGFISDEHGILNIDHHAPSESMYRQISSGNLAAEYVRKFGTFDGRIVNNHMDCDSVVSRLIMGGEIPPHAEFEKAVIATDHTGAENAIGDLLQALDVARDLRFSTRNLGLLLSGQALDPLAHEILQRRYQIREETALFVATHDIEMNGRLATVRFDGPIRSEFLPALIPEAAAILMIEPGSEKTELRPIVHLRIGNAAPQGFTLFDLGIGEFDPHFGGRWNAGSNKRGGGTRIETAQYVENVAKNLTAALARRSITAQ